MAVPAIIFVVCLAAGAFAAWWWLPDLGPGTLGRLSYFTVCGLLAATLGVFGLRVYGIVEDLGEDSGRGGRIVLADGLESMLWSCGLLIGLAAGVYVLAATRPGVKRADEPARVSPEQAQ